MGEVIGTDDVTVVVSGDALYWHDITFHRGDLLYAPQVGIEPTISGTTLRLTITQRRVPSAAP